MPSKSHPAGHFLLSLGRHARPPSRSSPAVPSGARSPSSGQAPESLPVKRISAVRYEPFRLAVGMGMGQPLYDWIKAALAGAPVAKNGSVALASPAGKAEAYRHFRDALVQEVGFPALDGSSKETAYFTVTLSPEQITHAAGDGAKLKAAVSLKQKRWLGSNFRFRLTGLEDACKRVATVDAFTIKQTLVEVIDGAPRIRTKHPTTLEIPNLRITFSAADVKPWQDWFDDFVVKGNAGPGNEKSGAIEFLDPSLKVTLGTLDPRTVRHLLARLRPAGEQAGATLCRGALRPGHAGRSEERLIDRSRRRARHGRVRARCRREPPCEAAPNSAIRRRGAVLRLGRPMPPGEPALLRLPGFPRFASSAMLNTVAFAGEQVVLGWLVLDLTNSPLLVGVALALRMLRPRRRTARRRPGRPRRPYRPPSRRQHDHGAGPHDRSAPWPSSGVPRRAVLALTVFIGCARALQQVTQQVHAHDLVGAPRLTDALGPLGIAHAPRRAHGRASRGRLIGIAARPSPTWRPRPRASSDPDPPTALGASGRPHRGRHVGLGGACRASSTLHGPSGASRVLMALTAAGKCSASRTRPCCRASRGTSFSGTGGAGRDERRAPGWAGSSAMLSSGA